MRNSRQWHRRFKKIKLKTLDSSIKINDTSIVVETNKPKTINKYMNPAILISKTGSISAIINGQSFNVTTDHPNYTRLLEAVRSSAWESFKALADVASSVRSFVGNGKVRLVDGAVTFNGEILDNSITDRILTLMNKNLPFSPMVKFLENLMQNPSKRAVDELYTFLEAGSLPITEDGHFLAFKNVRADYFDIHSGTKRNQVGDKPSMERNTVDEDKARTCSQGLHFCSESYLPHFSHSEGGHTMIVKINPADVVAIPADYANAKGRCCKYEVVAEMVGKPSDYTDRAVISDFDPKSDGLDGEGANPPYSEAYTAGYEAGFADAENGHYCPSENQPLDYYDGYDNAQDDFDVNDDDDEDETPCNCGSCGGSRDGGSIYGVKPSGDKFYNVHGRDGRFVRR